MKATLIVCLCKEKILAICVVVAIEKRRADFAKAMMDADRSGAETAVFEPWAAACFMD